MRPRDVLDRAEHTRLDELPRAPAHRVEPELEVDEVDAGRVAGGVDEAPGGLDRGSERLVAQHRPAGLERDAHVPLVQERRRVHRHEVDPRIGDRRRDGGLVASRDDRDDLDSFGRREARCDHTRAEAGADHRDPESPRRHSPSTSCESAGTGRWNRRTAKWVTGPRERAMSGVPTPTLPPSSQPATSTESSSTVRTTHNR